MKVYHLKRTMVLPVSLDEAWQFFATPINLPRITPTSMDFKMVYNSGDPLKMYAGQLIEYRVKVAAGIRVRWLTEITHVNKPYYFVDEQRFGPYALWHHQHMFKQVDAGVEMTDEVNYAIPMGPLGRLANVLFVERQLNDIFECRKNALDKIFVATKETA